MQVSKSCKGSFYISKAYPSIYRLKGYILQNPGLGFAFSCASSDSHSLCIAIFAFHLHILPVSLLPLLFSLLFSPSVPLSPPAMLPGERGAGSAADVGGGAEEARGGREEASGRDGPQAEAGGGGGEDERETLLPGQWSSGRRRAAGRTERRGGVEGGDGRLGGEDERRETKERLGIWEDQRLFRKGKEWKGGWIEGTERQMDGGMHKRI